MGIRLMKKLDILIVPRQVYWQMVIINGLQSIHLGEIGGRNGSS